MLDTITLTSDDKQGSLKVKNGKILNISSIPKQYLALLLSRVGNMPKEIRICNLFDEFMYCYEKKHFVKLAKNKRSVTLVYDEDTKNINTMIQNINKFTSNKVINKIMVKKEDNKTKLVSRKGITIFMCNPHHTKETIKTLGCTNSLQQDSSSYAYINIIKTTDPLCGGIAGLTMTLNYLKIPFTVDTRYFRIDQSWLLLKKDPFHEKYEVFCDGKNTFDETSNKSSKLFLMGYTTMLPTEKGYLPITQKKVTTAKQVASIFDTLKQLFKDICSWFARQFNRWFVTPKKTKNKNRKK